MLSKIEKIQKENVDWWDKLSQKDKEAINEGLEQLDRGEFLTREQVREKLKNKFNF